VNNYSVRDNLKFIILCFLQTYLEAHWLFVYSPFVQDIPAFFHSYPLFALNWRYSYMSHHDVSHRSHDWYPTHPLYQFPRIYHKLSLSFSFHIYLTRLSWSSDPCSSEAYLNLLSANSKCPSSRNHCSWM